MEDITWITRKMDGAKNSFIITAFPTPDSEKQYKSQVVEANLSEHSVQLCLKHQVDGAVFLKDFQKDSPNYKWDFYNADGSVAEMCGNAARCVAGFSFEAELAPERHSFMSLAGLINTEYIKEGTTKIQTSILSPEPKQENLQIEGFKDTQFYFVNSGVPHAVIVVNELTLDKLKPIAKAVRSHSHFPQGTNVSFYVESQSGEVEAVSFERGVEDFTQACGTGAVAVAYIYQHLNQESSLVKVNMPGGQLQVDFNSLKSPWLIGPVRYI